MTNIPLLVASLAGGAADAVAMGRSQDEFCRAVHARLAMEPDLNLDQRARLTLFAEQAFALAQPAPALKTYSFRVEFDAKAFVRGSINVTAENEKEAERQARTKFGDITWEYNDRDESEEPEMIDCSQVSA